ncbi:fibrinogen C domain-containing protein 1-like [Anopheles aquasalis]|uniref:fibrinogen C domain-containing protein 1-like n=1 Tax=Anopheles aquasalis TaxID=42839 RepID=UPI00215A9381|nr:fibrinogen C domain-containing protein 1-like [Anopheles aquasalis]
MDRLLWSLLVSLTVAARSKEVKSNVLDKPQTDSVSGFALELLLNQQDTLLYNFREIQQELRELRKSISETQSNQQQLRSTLSNMTRTYYGYFPSCKAVPIKVSGKYNIRASESVSPFIGFCEQEKFEGGWLIIQQRSNGTLDFDRDWIDYRNGFGQVGEEVWIGLEQIHQMTTARACELLVELTDFDGTHKYARYSRFVIGSEAEQYRIRTLGTYSGTAGDAFGKHNEMMFTTRDRDNDKDKENCARQYNGGWWFKNCHIAFLHGPYVNNSGKKSGIFWYPFKNSWSGLSSSKMLIRPL